MKRMYLFLLMMALGVSTVSFGQFGAVLQELATPGPCPTGLVWGDGQLWLLDRHQQAIYAIDPANGAVLSRLPTPGFFPTGIAWDGAALWISDICTGDDCTGQIFQVDPGTGDVLRTLVSPVAWPMGLAWDDGALWIQDDRRDKLIRVDPVDGTVLAEFHPPHLNPTGVAFDGKYLWLADRGRDRIYLFHPESGEVLFDLAAPGPYVWGLAWDGRDLWCADYQSRKLFRLRTDGETPYVLGETHRHHLRVTTDVRTRGEGFVHEGLVSFALPEESPAQRFVTQPTFSEEPTEIVADKWGQRVANFRYEELPAGQSRQYSWEADVELRDMRWKIYPDKVGSAEDIPEEVRRLYLADSIKYDIHNAFIQDVVRRVVGGEKNLYWKARKLYNYVIDTLEYQRTGGWETAPIVLQRGDGSCSEYTFSYIALCRAAGVPARYSGALVIRGDDASLDWVYHRWGEIYLPGYGWIPVDANHGDKPLPADRADGFGALDGRFVITTRCGGFSEYLEWSYNGFTREKTTARCRVAADTIAEWSPVE
jgi:transglutaminase-like putative cysteine protease